MAVDTARAKSLFLAASDLDDLAERAAYLERECGGDAELRARVEALLRANDAAPLPAAEAQDGTSAHIPGGPQQTVDHGDPTARIGSIIAGKYKLIEEIGEGGMGSVYLAQQTESVRRAVAVKVIKAGMDSKAVLARFEAERQALAMMDHPNIAKVLDAGTTDGGRPFFVMELVKGQPITKYCDELKLTPRQRLELFVPVCQAIQHAHQKGVIHRDIKPSNVLVAMYDDRPVPKVIDFGVAKAAGQSLTDKTLMTGLGAIVGTAEYMSPEQASLNNLDIDTRSDVYSLGVLLYELLTGTTPVDRKSLGKAAVLEILRIVREVDVPKPSHRLSTAEGLPSVAANRGTEPAKLSKLMKGELDWVLLKALEKDRTRRYETANGLARDIQRYLADEIVEARPPSAGYRLKKIVRRNPLQLALAGTIAALLLGVGAVVWWQNEQAGMRREADLRRQLQDEQRAAADNARLARNAEAVAALLGQCEEALRTGDAAQAAIALEAARKRSAEGGASDQAERLGRLDADLALLRDLDEIDQFRLTWTVNQFADPEVVATRQREALRRFGADPDVVSVDEAVARVSDSAVRERIVSALDRLLRQQRTAGVRAVLQRVDADPYRNAVRDAVLAADRTRIVELATQDDALEQPPGFASFLGESGLIGVERRRKLLEVAVSRRPGDLYLLLTLGTIYSANHKEGVDERLRWYQAAVAAAPANSVAHNNLGLALYEKGRMDEAIACYRKAIAVDPKFVPAHTNLGFALYKNGQMAEAIVYHRKAIALDSNCAQAHSNLGTALYEKGQVDEAIVYHRKAIALDPKLANAHNNLATALAAKGQVDEAIACYKKAIELDPNAIPIHNNLGVLLCEAKRDSDGAAACFRKAIELDPKDTNSHCNLGLALARKGQLVEAIACYKKALSLDPNLARVRCNLGGALYANGQLDEAIGCYRKAIALDPKEPNAHMYLGHALASQGRFAESLAAFKRGHELGMKLRGWRYPSAELIRQAEAKAALEAKLPAFLKGEFQPGDNKERLDLAVVCQGKKLHHTASGLYTAAFAADPKLAGDLGAVHRYRAACSAALAAAGQGEDAAQLDDHERTRLRKQALDWLRVNLALRTRQLKGDKPADRAAVLQTMRHWQQDTDLASIRDAAALAKLPADEQKALTQLWADVAALRKQVEENKSQEVAPPRGEK